MRLLLLILMIALMPLRGWAGEAMSVAMAAEQLMMVHETPSDIGKTNAAHPDCMGHSGHETTATGDSGDAEGDQVAGHCPTCSACQVCSSAALALQIRIPLLLAAPHGLPSVGGISYTSAEPAPGFKPPIS